MDKIALTQTVRSNLLTLQGTNDLIDKTQQRLATGLKVNSALDDASAFFQARALTERASDLTRLKENIDQSISTIQAAIDGLESITSLIEQAKGLATKAKSSGSASERSGLAAQFDDLLTQIDALAGDTSYNGVNLIDSGTDQLEIDFNEDGSSKLTISHIKSTTSVGGLSVATAIGNWSSDGAINAALGQLNSALTELRTNSAAFGSNNTVLQARLNFTNSLVSTLEGGAGKLTLADMNGESANLLALQTRQQLAINSLSLAAQNERSVLSLFGG